jgi:hypothetical protein
MGAQCNKDRKVKHVCCCLENAVYQYTGKQISPGESGKSMKNIDRAQVEGQTGCDPPEI